MYLEMNTTLSPYNKYPQTIYYKAKIAPPILRSYNMLQFILLYGY